MTDPTTTDAGRRYALTPHPGPVEDILYRIHPIFEEPDGRLCSSGTEPMASNIESAKAMAEYLNSPLGFDCAS